MTELAKQRLKCATSPGGAPQGAAPSKGSHAAVSRVMSKLRGLGQWWNRTRTRLRERIFARSSANEKLEMAFAAMCANVEKLHERIAELEERNRPQMPGRNLPDLNFTTKSLAIKLSRNGQDARHISGVLGVPLGEVSLLLKVQRLQSSRAPVADAAPGSSTPVIPIKKGEVRRGTDGFEGAPLRPLLTAMGAER